MEALDTLPWMVLLGLGALHGINPAMGWLFAVALGMQEEERGAVWRALGPMALGHALAIAAAIAAGALVGLVVPLSLLKWIVAGLLVAFGVSQLVRHRHPGGAGMRVGGKELTLWSFLMATAHGAGLMVLPFVLGPTAGGISGAGAMATAANATATGGAGSAATGTGALASLPPEAVVAIAATLLHTASYLLVTGVVAAVVYEKLGLRFLRSAWINLDLLWALALIATAAVTPFL